MPNKPIGEWHAGDMLSENVLADLNGIPLSCALVVEYLDEDGDRLLASYWDGDASFHAREGMVRSLLRDVTALPDAATRRNAERRLDSEDD